MGRHRSHTRRITGLEFGTREDGRVSLVSVGEDKYLVEYNLPASNQVSDYERLSPVDSCGQEQRSRSVKVVSKPSSNVGKTTKKMHNYLGVVFESPGRMRAEQETGLLITEAPKRIEQSGLPSALLWHPLLGSDFEDRLVREIGDVTVRNSSVRKVFAMIVFFVGTNRRCPLPGTWYLQSLFCDHDGVKVTANDDFKLKEWNAENKSCRKTTIGPTFGGPINQLKQINHIHVDGHLRPSAFAAYGTSNKVVGLVSCIACSRV